MKYWEIIADNLSKAGWSWGLRVSVRFQRANDVDRGRASRDGQCFIVHADEELTAFVEMNQRSGLAANSLDKVGRVF